MLGVCVWSVCKCLVCGCVRTLYVGICGNVCTSGCPCACTCMCACRAHEYMESFYQTAHNPPPPPTKEEVRKSRSMQKGAAFKLNLHPRDQFDDNPYHANKCKGCTCVRGMAPHYGNHANLRKGCSLSLW